MTSTEMNARTARRCLADAVFHLKVAEKALNWAERKADGPDHQRRAKNLYEQAGRLRGAAVRAHDMLVEEERRELKAIMEAAA
jgi:hypothetical protein